MFTVPGRHFTDDIIVSNSGTLLCNFTEDILVSSSGTFLCDCTDEIIVSSSGTFLCNFTDEITVYSSRTCLCNFTDEIIIYSSETCLCNLCNFTDDIIVLATDRMFPTVTHMTDMPIYGSTCQPRNSYLQALNLDCVRGRFVLEGVFTLPTLNAYAFTLNTRSTSTQDACETSTAELTCCYRQSTIDISNY